MGFRVGLKVVVVFIGSDQSIVVRLGRAVEGFRFGLAGGVEALGHLLKGFGLVLGEVEILTGVFKVGTETQDAEVQHLQVVAVVGFLNFGLDEADFLFQACIRFGMAVSA